MKMHVTPKKGMKMTIKSDDLMKTKERLYLQQGHGTIFRFGIGWDTFTFPLKMYWQRGAKSDVANGQIMEHEYQGLGQHPDSENLDPRPLKKTMLVSSGLLKSLMQ